MTSSDLHVRVHPGDGVVANFGAAVLVCLPKTPVQEKVTDALLECVENAAAEGPTPGRTVARGIAELLGTIPPNDVPAFAVVSPADDGLAVMLKGEIELELDQPGGRIALSGGEAITWVDRVIKAAYTQLDIHASGAHAAVTDVRSRLQRGIVAGAGATLLSHEAHEASPSSASGASSVAVVPQPDPVAPPMPVAPVRVENAPPVAPVHIKNQIAALPAEQQPQVAPLPIDKPAAVAPQPVAKRVTVPPPTGGTGVLGVLVCDDGSTLQLDDNYVLGRDPFDHPHVAGGLARPFVFAESDKEISRAHTFVTVTGSVVSVTDLGSANGTYVAPPGAMDWHRLVAETPTQIGPGHRLLIGQRTFVFHAPQP